MMFTRFKRGGIWSYLFAFLLLLTALAVRLEIAPANVGLQYVTFFPAVTLGAVICGLGPGLFTTLLGTLLATYLFTPPYHSFSMPAVQASFWPNLVFILNGVIVCVAIESVYRYRLREQRRVQQIIDHLSSCVVLMDTHTVILEVNRPLLAQAGSSREEIIGQKFLHLPWWSHDEKIQARLVVAIQKALEGDIQRYDMSIKVGDVPIVVDFQIAPIVNVSGQIINLLAMWLDISVHKQTEEALRIAAIAFETHDGILITDMHRKIIQVNHAFQTTTGYSLEEALGQTPHLLKSGRHDDAFYAALWQELSQFGRWSGEILDRHKNGDICPKWLTITAVKDEGGEVTHYIAIFTDITALKKAENEISHLAFYDVLTALPNRRLLLDRLQQALWVSARSEQYGAVLFLDMDRFKILNDTLGHPYGDRLLVEVAQRLQSCVRKMDTVARWGGDEFVVLIEGNSAHIEEASQRTTLIAEKIRAALAAPYQLDGCLHYSSSSIGICLYRGDEKSVDTLLRFADIALHQAKASGRNTVRLFDPVMQQTVENKTTIEADLRHALAHQQLRLYYQLQVDNDRRPLGAEALVRWLHPVRGLISPMHFIPIAEESSLIFEVGHWVLETACYQLAGWSCHEKTCDLSIAVNVSAKQFHLPNFVEGVATLLKTYQINPARLKLELTESVIVQDVAGVVVKMQALKALGVGLSIDDFGTGYSSLSYLKRLPVDQLKIDQSFVRDITLDHSDAMMVKTIINLAENFNLNVIAEGVETEEQRAFLHQHHCTAYQGYLFSKPVPVDEFEKLIGVG